MAERQTLCMTCHHPLSPHQSHPPVIGQRGAVDSTQLGMIDAITPLCCFLDAVQEAICQLSHREAEDDATAKTIHDLSWLGQELTGEIQRRAEWLYKLGTASLAAEQEDRR